MYTLRDNIVSHTYVQVHMNLLGKLFHFYNENHKNIHRKMVEMR